MTTATKARPARSEMQTKSMPTTFLIDEAQGIVECFVAAVGNKDSVGDIVMPGAFAKSLRRRKPRVVWGHDWNQPIGKVLEMYEVGPSDPRLPPKMKDAGVGGLFAKVQFNLKSARGRQAFDDIVFFGEEQEWSIGYKTLDSFFDKGKQANMLKELELFEVSPVLHGANQLTATVSIKSALEQASQAKALDVAAVRSLVAQLLSALSAEDAPAAGPEPLPVPTQLSGTPVPGDDSSHLWDEAMPDDDGDEADEDPDHDGDDDDGGPDPDGDGGDPMGLALIRQVLGLAPLAPMPAAKAGDCGCGCGGTGTCGDSMKALVNDLGELRTKVGRVISGRNLERLRQAATLIHEVVAAAEAGMATVEQKDAQSALDEGEYVVIETVPEAIAEIKAYLDDFAAFHGADVLVDEAGGEWVAIEGKSDEMVELVVGFFADNAEDLQIKGFSVGQADCPTCEQKSLEMSTKALPFVGGSLKREKAVEAGAGGAPASPKAPDAAAKPAASTPAPQPAPAADPAASSNAAAVKQAMNEAIHALWSNMQAGKAPALAFNDLFAPGQDGTLMPRPGVYASADGKALFFLAADTDGYHALVLRQDGNNLDVPDAFSMMRKDAGAGLASTDTKPFEDLLGQSAHFSAANPQDAVMLIEHYQKSPLPLNASAHLKALADTMAKVSAADHTPWDPTSMLTLAKTWDGDDAEAEVDPKKDNPFAPWLSDGSVKTYSLDPARAQRQLTNLKSWMADNKVTLPDLSSFTPDELNMVRKAYAGANGAPVTRAGALLALLAHYEYVAKAAPK